MSIDVNFILVNADSRVQFGLEQLKSGLRGMTIFKGTLFVGESNRKSEVEQIQLRESQLKKKKLTGNIKRSNPISN